MRYGMVRAGLRGKALRFTRVHFYKAAVDCVEWNAAPSNKVDMTPSPHMTSDLYP